MVAMVTSKKPAAVPAPAPTPTPAPAQPQPTPTPTPAPAQPAQQAAPRPDAGLAVGPQYEEAIANLMGLGFSHEQVQKQ